MVQDGSTAAGTPNLLSPMREPSCALDQKNLKRNIDNHLGRFPARGNENGRRKRQRYSNARRQDVALVRKVNACFRCRSGKVPCKFPGPCGACEKMAGSVVLARHICVRQSLLDTRFGGVDILSHAFTQDLLEGEIGAFEGEKRLIACNLYSGVQPITALPLWLQVRDYKTPSELSKPLLYDYMIGLGPQGPVFNMAVSERYAIVPESLPTAEELEIWIRQAPEQNATPGLMTALGNFIGAYCEHQTQLPMHDILKNASTIFTLLRFLRNWKMTTTPSGGITHISRAIVAQLVIVVKNRIRVAECDLLASLHQHVYSTKGPGRENSIPLWAALWALIAMYRNCMAYYKNFSRYRIVALEHDPADSDSLIAASKYMYDILTTTYSSLFRASTPLYLDWRVEENFELLGKSEVVKEAFVALKTEIWWFYDPAQRLGTEDALLQSIIIDQERMLKPRRPSDA